MTREELIKQLTGKSKEMRLNILEIAGKCENTHVPSASSCCDIVTALYFHFMNYDPKNPLDKNRDRFILSAGHKSMVQYAALNLLGVIPDEMIDTIEQYNSPLAGHPVYKKCPGVEASTGSLGHGLSIAAGMAQAAKMDGEDYKVYCIVGDGESNEGSIWEAAMSAAKYKLDNLVMILDRNRMSATYPISMPMTDYKAALESFGFACREINGNNMAEVVEALETLPYAEGKPNAIIANTIKGYGIPFAINTSKWHAAYWSPEKVAEAKKLIEEMEG